MIFPKLWIQCSFRGPETIGLPCVSAIWRVTRDLHLKSLIKINVFNDGVRGAELGKQLDFQVLK